MATISDTPRPGYAWDSTDNCWYPIGTGPHTHPDYITQSTAINPSIVDAKGDIIAASAADTVARLAVGANDTVLTADSSTATGLKWAAPASSQSYENYTLLNSGSTALSGAGSTYTLSSISDISKIVVLGDAVSSSSATSEITIRINSDSGSNYGQFGAAFTATSSYSDSSTLGQQGFNTLTAIKVIQIAAASAGSDFSFSIDGGRTTGLKAYVGTGGINGTNSIGYITQGIYSGSAAITSISILTSAGTFDAGNVYIYGSAV